MKKINLLSLLALVSVSAFMVGCDKTKPYDIEVPDAQVHFTGARNQTYTVTAAPVAPYTVTIGTTDVQNTDRTVTFEVTSTTGLTLGNQYTLSTTGNTVTIPAGQATASFDVQANAASFANGEKDTLMITLKEPSVKVASFQDTLLLALRGPCFEGDVDLNLLLGSYRNTNETFSSAYGPYTTTISAVNQTSATTGTITVTNIFDFGWSPITFALDWTNPAARTSVVSPAQQDNIAPGTTVGNYPGTTVTITPPTAAAFPGQQTGTFSICNQTVTLRMRICVLPTGCFTNNMYTVNLIR